MQIDLKYIKMLQKGDDTAFEWLRQYCYRKALFFLKHHEESQDIASDAVAKVVVAIKTYKPKKGKGTVESNFKAWVGQIVRNAINDYRTEQQKEASIDLLSNAMDLDAMDREFIKNGAYTLDNVLSTNIYCQSTFSNNPLWNLAVRDVLDKVRMLEDPRDRIALLLKFLYGFKIYEIADIIGENQNAIQTVIYRARHILKGIFEDEGIGPDYLKPSDWRLGFAHVEKKGKAHD